MRSPARFLVQVAVIEICLLLCGGSCGWCQSAAKKFAVGNVWAKYVTGTKQLTLLGKLGCLESTEQSLEFIQKKKVFWMKFWDWRLTERIVHLMDPSWGKGPCGNPADGDFSILFGSIGVLSRGQVLAAGGSDHKSPVDILTALGGFAGLASAVNNGDRSEVVLGLGAAAGLLGTTALIAQLNKKTDNYVTVFYGCKGDNSPPGTTPSGIHVINSSVSGSQIQASPSASRSDELFKKDCDVAVFQLIDPHDFWNLSELLTGRTGLEFVAQTAEKGGASK